MAHGTSPEKPQEKNLHPKIVLGEEYFISPATPHALFPFGQNLPWRSFITWSLFQLLGLPDTMSSGMPFYPRLEVAGGTTNSRPSAGQPGCAVTAPTFPGPSDWLASGGS